MIIKLIVFAIGTLGIIFISLHSASKLRSYGFLRFFTFESILVLILFNVEHWFRNPFSIPQIVSWLPLIASVVMVASGFYMLRMFGKPKDVIDDTAVLVKQGIYKYIRHPFYSSYIWDKTKHRFVINILMDLTANRPPHFHIQELCIYYVHDSPRWLDKLCTQGQAIVHLSLTKTNALNIVKKPWTL